MAIGYCVDGKNRSETLVDAAWQGKMRLNTYNPSNLPPIYIVTDVLVSVDT
jgi:hypothetical protein